MIRKKGETHTKKQKKNRLQSSSLCIIRVYRLYREYMMVLHRGDIIIDLDIHRYPKFWTHPTTKPFHGSYSGLINATNKHSGSEATDDGAGKLGSYQFFWMTL